MNIMKKIKNRYKSYNGISALEQELVALIREYDLIVFGIKELRRLSKLSLNQLHNLLFSLERKGFLIRIKKNKYVLREEVIGREFEIATQVANPSYVSFWSALSFYGFTEQQVKLIQLVSTKQVKEFKFGNYRVEVSTFTSSKFFGYEKINGFSIADKEKSLVDSLSNFEKSGGASEFSKCLANAWNEINKKKFVDYLIKFNNASIISRAGFLIEELNLELNKELAEKLIKNKSKSFIKLVPSKPKSREYNKKWRINVNEKIKLEAGI